MTTISVGKVGLIIIIIIVTIMIMIILTVQLNAQVSK